MRTYSGSYGRRYFKKFIVYEFTDQRGKIRQGEYMLWEGSPKDVFYPAVREADPVTVYYFPNRPSQSCAAIAPDIQ